MSIFLTWTRIEISNSVNSVKIKVCKRNFKLTLDYEVTCPIHKGSL